RGGAGSPDRGRLQRDLQEAVRHRPSRRAHQHARRGEARQFLIRSSPCWRPGHPRDAWPFYVGSREELNHRVTESTEIAQREDKRENRKREAIEDTEKSEHTERRQRTERRKKRLEQRSQLCDRCPSLFLCLSLSFSVFLGVLCWSLCPRSVTLFFF